MKIYTEPELNQCVDELTMAPCSVYFDHTQVKSLIMFRLPQTDFFDQNKAISVLRHPLDVPQVYAQVVPLAQPPLANYQHYDNLLPGGQHVSR